MSVAVPILGRSFTKTVTPIRGSPLRSLTDPMTRSEARFSALSAAAALPMTICRPESFQVFSVPAKSTSSTSSTVWSETLIDTRRGGVENIVVIDENTVALVFDAGEYLLEGDILQIERDAGIRGGRLCDERAERPDCGQQKQDFYP